MMRLDWLRLSGYACLKHLDKFDRYLNKSGVLMDCSVCDSLSVRDHFHVHDDKIHAMKTTQKYM